MGFGGHSDRLRLPRSESSDHGPEPPRTRAARHARYKRSHSYPGGPNCGPEDVTAINLIDVKPKSRCTVKMATKRIAAIGTLTSGTKAPARTATPQSNSRTIVAQPIIKGAG